LRSLARAEGDVTRKKFEQADQEYGKLLEASHRRIGVDFEIAEYYRDRGRPAHGAALPKPRRWTIRISA